MSVFGTEPMVEEFGVVFFDVSRSGFFEQVIAAVHQHAESVERSHYFRCVGDDRFVHVLVQRRHEVVGYGAIDAEFDFFRVDEHEFQFVGMFLVEQRSDDGVHADRLSLTGCSSHEQVWNLCQIYHIDLVHDGFSERHGQFHALFRFLELLRVENALHGDDICLGVGHFDTDGSFSRYRCDDAYAHG